MKVLRKNMYIQSLSTHDKIAKSFDTFSELRPHFAGREVFIAQVKDQQK